MSALYIATRRTADIDGTLQHAIVQMCTAAHGNDFGSLFSFLPPEGLPLLRTAYVDAVATSPTHQLRGIGSAVMRRLAEAAAAEGYEIAGLESDLRGFYERLGWKRWRGPLAGRGEMGLVPTPGQEGVFVLRLPKTPPLDLHGLLTAEAGGRIW